MIKQSEIEKLIINGFDLKLISYELDIPIEQVIECNKNIESRAKVGRNYTDIIEEMNNNAHLRMEEMRRKYRELVSKNETANTKPKKATPKQKAEIIETTIKTIEEKIKEMKGKSKKERRYKTREILKLLKEIKQYPFTIEQAEKLNLLFEAEELTHLRIDMVDRIEFFIDLDRTTIAVKLAEALEIAYEQTENIQELKALTNKITYKMVQRNPVMIGGVKTKIDTKIAELEHEKAIDAIKNNINEQIESIIIDLAQGTLEIDKAREIIAEEAKVRIKNKPKTIFSLTEEQEKRQILMQIRTALREKADKYQIENPIATIEQLTRAY